MRQGQSSKRQWPVCGLLIITALTLTTSQADMGSLENRQPLIEDSSPAPIVDIAEAASVWTTDKGLTQNALFLLSHIKRAKSEGLDPSRYHYDTLNALADEQWHAGLRQPYNELMATAFKQLVTDLGQGVVIPKTAQSAWFQDIKPVDADSAYLALKQSGNTVETVLNQYRPQHSTYLKLAEKLENYLDLEAQGGWPRVPPGKPLKPGMTSQRVAVLKKRLQITGDLGPGTNEINMNLFTPELLQAVKKFQARNGLIADGVVGKNTYRVLNVPVEHRIETIRINLERLRWLPRDLGERYVFTNIADYRLHVVEHGKEILTMPVVVGKKKFMTPVFSDEIEWIVFNPTWTVPKSIMYQELLPKELKNPGYLQRNNFELFREENGAVVVREPDTLRPEEWTSHPFRYTLRQKTGGRNALGNTKFIFPNEYSVYLHDTPAKSLFNRNTRAYSHGCVRVGDPETLAETLLGFQGVTPRRIKELRALKKAKTIALREHVPTHIAYLTSWVDNEGTLQFRRDLYGHDKGLTQALKRPSKVAWPASVLAILDDE